MRLAAGGVRHQPQKRRPIADFLAALPRGASLKESRWCEPGAARLSTACYQTVRPHGGDKKHTARLVMGAFEKRAQDVSWCLKIEVLKGTQRLRGSS